jgi:protein-tyrosine phosphatase
MRIIDFHSHILPGIDDGSKSVDMTTQMLRTAEAQNIDVFVATPHFYSERTTMNRFLDRRRRAYEQVAGIAEQLGIWIICGAEVAFFPGMSRGEGIEHLCIGNTNLMMVEMPFRSWEGRDLKELERLMDRGIQPVMAHLERFVPGQPDKGMISELLDLPVYIQINAECLTRWTTRGKPLQLFQKGKAHLLGSDCHNVTTRRENLAQGREALAKKLGQRKLREIDRLGTALLFGEGY